ncbi:hypothetical protein ACGC1H_001598 [Rhizoctonia solani]
MCHHETKYNEFESCHTIMKDNVKQTSDDFGIARGGKGAILYGILSNQTQHQTVIGIKRLYINGGGYEVEQALRREIAVWCNLENQNVLELLGIVVLSPTQNNYLPKSTVFHYYTHGDLKEYRTNSKPNDLEILNFAIRQQACLIFINRILFMVI